MNWKLITSTADLTEINSLSNTQKVLIFKHSTRCSISSAALGRIERKWKPEDEAKVVPYFLDLLNYREVSTEIAALYDIPHQSPQILIISNGKCISSETHFDINYETIMRD